ncbi:hypothetical protein EVAR_5728_1, partial [Eumeta japonica]
MDSLEWTDKGLSAAFPHFLRNSRSQKSFLRVRHDTALRQDPPNAGADRQPAMTSRSGEFALRTILRVV